jgi:hypothetical protein
MARSKPNKTLKSPHKQQIEEQNKQDKSYTTTNVTPYATKTSKRKTLWDVNNLLVRYRISSISYTHCQKACPLFHLADPDFRAPHLLRTGGVPGFYDDDDDDGVIAALLHEDVVIVALLQVALRVVGLL